MEKKEVIRILEETIREWRYPVEANYYELKQALATAIDLLKNQPEMMSEEEVKKIIDVSNLRTTANLWYQETNMEENEAMARIEKEVYDLAYALSGKIAKPKEEKVITFEKSALKEICKMLNVPYDENIIAFTKKGVIRNVFDLIEPKPKEHCECKEPKRQIITTTMHGKITYAENCDRCEKPIKPLPEPEIEELPELDRVDREDEHKRIIRIYDKINQIIRHLRRER